MQVIDNQFGKKLYSIFFKTYTEKVWGMPCTEISADWAAQRIQNFSLGTAMKKMLIPGGGDDGVDPPVLVEGGLKHRLVVGHRRSVGSNRMCGASVGLDLGDSCRQQFLVEIPQHDRCTLGDEPLRRCPTDTARSPGDHRHLSIELAILVAVHRFLLPWWRSCLARQPVDNQTVTPIHLR